MNNENKNLSRNRNGKKRNLRRIKDDDRLAYERNAIKKAKRKNNFIEIKNLDKELVKLKSSNRPDKLQSGMEELTKIDVFGKNLHENENEKMKDYTGDFEMVILKW